MYGFREAIFSNSTARYLLLQYVADGGHFFNLFSLSFFSRNFFFVYLKTFPFYTSFFVPCFRFRIFTSSIFQLFSKTIRKKVDVVEKIIMPKIWVKNSNVSWKPGMKKLFTISGGAKFLGLKTGAQSWARGENFPFHLGFNGKLITCILIFPFLICPNNNLIFFQKYRPRHLFISDISEWNNYHSETLDFRRGWVGEVTFFVLEVPDYKSAMLIYLYIYIE